MRLNLLKTVGKIGVLTECKPFLKERLEIEVDSEGRLILTVAGAPGQLPNQKAYQVKGGRVVINDYEIGQGINKITFSAPEGEYACGEIHRGGRFLHVKNQLDELAVFLALTVEAQQVEIDKLKKANKDIREQHSITII